MRHLVSISPIVHGYAYYIPILRPHFDMLRWSYIKPKLDKIMAGESMTMKAYMDLYAAIHSHCGGYIEGPGGRKILRGEDLYNRLAVYPNAYLRDVQSRRKVRTNEDLVIFYIKEWNQYTTASGYVNHAFRYLNRHWIKREMDEGKKNICEVHTLFMVEWKKFMVIEGVITPSVLWLLDKHRNGQTIDMSQIKSVLDSFVSIDDETADFEGEMFQLPRAYEHKFEAPFVEDATQYFRVRATQFRASKDTRDNRTDYVKWALELLRKEEERVKRHMLDRTMRPLVKSCYDALVGEYRAAFQDTSFVLSRAAEYGHYAIVELLLDEGNAEVDSKDVESRTPLSYAAGNGHDTIVRLLLETGKTNADSKDEAERTPLSHAAENGNDIIVKILLSQGKVDADSRDKSERTPLSYAAENGNDAIVKLLLDTGKIDADSKDVLDRTAFLYAAKNGHEAVVEILHKTGKVAIDSYDEAKRSPFSHAAGNGHDSIVWYLLGQNSVDINSRDVVKRTPLSWAAGNGCIDVVDRLVDTRDIDINSEDNSRRTPLSWATGNGHEGIVQSLLSKIKVDVDSRDLDARTPLMTAAMGDQIRILDLLLRKGAGIDAVDKDGRAALHHAAKEGKAIAVSELRRLGAWTELKDQNSMTASDLITSRKEFTGTEDLRIRIREILESQLYSEPLDTNGVQTLFKCSITRFWSNTKLPDEDDDDIENRNIVTVVSDDIVFDEIMEDKAKFRWLHLPANNVMYSIPYGPNNADSFTR